MAECTDMFIISRSMSRDGYYSPVGTTADLSFTDNGLAPATTYYYKITATKGGKVSDNFSNIAMATTFAAPLPAAPQGVTATALSASSIMVYWDSTVTGADYFNIYRATVSYDLDTTTWDSTINVGNYVKVGTSTTATFTNTGLSPSTTYYYKVTAVNANGESDFSNVAQATTLAEDPIAPTDGVLVVYSTNNFQICGIESLWQFYHGIPAHYSLLSHSGNQWKYAVPAGREYMLQVLYSGNDGVCQWISHYFQTFSIEAGKTTAIYVESSSFLRIYTY
jgi:chitodextrinase